MLTWDRRKILFLLWTGVGGQASNSESWKLKWRAKQTHPLKYHQEKKSVEYLGHVLKSIFSLFIIGTIQASIISSKRSTLNRELTTHCLIVFSDCIYRCVSWRRSHREELGVSRIRIRPELRFAFHRKKKHYIMSEGLRFPKEGGGFPKFSV